MAFSDKKYKTLGDVLKVFQLKHQFLNSFEEEITFNLPNYLETQDAIIINKKVFSLMEN